MDHDGRRCRHHCHWNNLRRGIEKRSGDQKGTAPLPSATSTQHSHFTCQPLLISPLVLNVDHVQERKRYQQASPEEIISQLTIARDDLVMKKKEMERKIAGFHEKKKAKELEAHRAHDQQQQQGQQPR